MKKLLLTLLTVVISVSAWAEDVTFTYSDYNGKGTSSSGSDYTMDDKTYVSIGDTKFYGNNNYAHFYAGGTITVTPKNGATITKISITTTGTSYNGYESSGTYTASTGSVAKNTSDNAIVEWTGSATSAFTLGHTKQIRWTKIVVTYSTSTKTLSSISVKTAPTKTTYNEGEFFNPAGLIITKTFNDASTQDVAYSGNESAFTFNPSLSTALQATNSNVTITVSSKSCTQAITVNALPSHTAHFSVNGTIDNNDDSNVKEGAAIVFPTDPASMGGKVFVGWTKTSNYTNASSAPSDLCKAATMGNADVTYYAVFANVQSTPEGWEKITDSKDVVAGVYAIISFDAGYYLANALATSDAPKVTAITKTNDKIDVKDEMKWNLTIDTNGSYIFESVSNTGKYLWGANTNEGIRITETSAKTASFKNWKLKSDDTYGLILMDNGSTGRYLSTYGTQDWRNYTSVSATNRAANIYKLVGGISYCNYVTTIPTEQSVTVNPIGNASFSCEYALNFTDIDDIKAYMVTAETEENVTLTEIKKVPANTGIFVVGEGGSYNIPVLNGDADDASANKLVATSTAKTVAEDENIWALSKSDGDLHPVSVGVTIGAGKAYLLSDYSATVSQARTIIMDEGETTGIDAVSNTIANGVAYNLAGQRVAANAKGLVIINGKKIINK